MDLRMTAGGCSFSFSRQHATLDKLELKKVAAELWKATFAMPDPAPETRMASPATSGATCFEIFPRLPKELQDGIWAHAADVAFDYFVGPWAWRCSRCQGDQLSLDWEKSEPILVLLLRKRMRSIPLFWVCRAARRAAIAAYGDPQKGDLIFNPAVDSVGIYTLYDNDDLDVFEKGNKLIGPNDSDIFIAVNIYSGRGTEHTIARCPLPNSDLLSRSLYQYIEPQRLGTEPFRGPKAHHRFYGISKGLQKRIRHVRVASEIHMIIETFSRGGPVARGLEATIGRFADVESVTIDLCRPLSDLQIYQGVTEPDLASLDAPEWWSFFILTLAGAGRPIRWPQGLKRINFTFKSGL